MLSCDCKAVVSCRMGVYEEKKETCGTICLKYLLFTFNFLFWVSFTPWHVRATCVFIEYLRSFPKVETVQSSCNGPRLPLFVKPSCVLVGVLCVNKVSSFCWSHNVFLLFSDLRTGKEKNKHDQPAANCQVLTRL